MRTIEELLQQAILLQAEAEEYALLIEGTRGAQSLSGPNPGLAHAALTRAGRELAATCFWMERDEEGASDTEVSE